MQRVLQNDAFSSSESLRKLLNYVGEKSLEGTAGHLKEYTIGVEAFGKPRDYDPQVDPAVRVVASKLRHKLEEYYLKDGAHDPIRIEMPRGHFALKFEHAHPESAGAEAKLALKRWRILAVVLASVACVSVAAAAYLGVRVWRTRPPAPNPPPLTPELELIWAPFLSSGRPVLISLGTPRFTKFKSGFFRNPRVNTDEEALEDDELGVIQRLLKSPYAVPSSPYTGAGEAIGAFRLGRFLHGRADHLTLTRSTSLHWDDMRTNNVVFLGAPKFNLQLYDVPVGDGFIIHDGAIRNPNPRSGEPDAFRSDWDTDHVDLLEDYALISRLRSLHGTGEIMALGAGSTEATWAAVEYVTQPGYARELVSRVGKSSGALPDCFQVVVRVSFKQLVPVTVSYATHRVLPPPWIGPPISKP